MRGRALWASSLALSLLLLGVLSRGTTAASTRALMASGGKSYQLHDHIQLFANKVGPFGSRALTRRWPTSPLLNCQLYSLAGFKTHP